MDFVDNFCEEQCLFFCTPGEEHSLKAMEVRQPPPPLRRKPCSVLCSQFYKQLCDQLRQTVEFQTQHNVQCRPSLIEAMFHFRYISSTPACLSPELRFNATDCKVHSDSKKVALTEALLNFTTESMFSLKRSWAYDLLLERWAASAFRTTAAFCRVSAGSS